MAALNIRPNFPQVAGSPRQEKVSAASQHLFSTVDLSEGDCSESE